MRKLLACVTVCVVSVLGVAACGDDDDGGNSARSDASTSSSRGGGGGNSGEFCDQAAAAQADAESFDFADDRDLDKIGDTVDDLADAAPGEIREEMRLVADTFEQAIEDAKRAGADENARTFAFVNAFTGDPEFVEATQRLSIYASEECDVSLDFGSEFDDPELQSGLSDLGDLSDYLGALSDLSDFTDLSDFGDLDGLSDLLSNFSDFSDFSDFGNLSDFSDFTDASDFFSS